MEQRLSLVTIGVSDLSRAQEFYRALGWAGQEVEDTVFFQAGGIAIVLWSHEKLAADCGIEAGDRSGFGGIALAQNVRSHAEVDDIIAAASAAGASITKQPTETFYGGYAGCFTDPDGNAWEIAHNPGFGLEPDGSLRLPDFNA